MGEGGFQPQKPPEPADEGPGVVGRNLSLRLIGRSRARGVDDVGGGGTPDRKMFIQMLVTTLGAWERPWGVAIEERQAIR